MDGGLGGYTARLYFKYWTPPSSHSAANNDHPSVSMPYCELVRIKNIDDGRHLYRLEGRDVCILHRYHGMYFVGQSVAVCREQSTLLVLKKPVCYKLKHIGGMLPRKQLNKNVHLHLVNTGVVPMCMHGH